MSMMKMTTEENENGLEGRIGSAHDTISAMCSIGYSGHQMMTA